MKKLLYKSSTDKKICGVCGGFAEYLDMDPTVVRVIYAVLAMILPKIPGIIFYFVLAFIMPEKEGYNNSNTDNYYQNNNQNTYNASNATEYAQNDYTDVQTQPVNDNQPTSDNFQADNPQEDNNETSSEKNEGNEQ